MKQKRKSIETIILDIEGSEVQSVKMNSKHQTFELQPHSFLTKHLSGWAGALLVRSILHQLNINEHHVFRWRLENKYLQYLVLNNYAPGCMPKTISFITLFKDIDGVQRIKLLLKKGFFIKATLGHGSGRTKSFDRTAEFANIVSSLQKNDFNDKWILQKKLHLEEEFRIHTFNQDIIHGLTFVIKGSNPLNHHLNAEKFIKIILEKLPDNILQGTLIGWDIGCTSYNRYYIIEANFTGFHPEYNRGFQTTGYVEDNNYGPIICAWLNNYFRDKYATSIETVENSLISQFQFYRDFIFYKRIFKSIDFNTYANKIKTPNICLILHLGEHTNSMMIKLITYFTLVSFAKKYYIIINAESVPHLNNLFSEKDEVRFLVESMLFTANQYQLVKQLNPDRRKKICCYHATRIIKDGSWIIL